MKSLKHCKLSSMRYRLPLRRSGDAGFTLLELLISLSIFAVLAAMSYGGLRTVLDTRERTERQAAQLAEIQLAFTILGRDIEQAIPRNVRDNFGDIKVAMLGEEEGEPLIEFTRTGWRNPAGQVRSNLQRVAYNVKDERLIRSTWNVLDQAQNTEPQETVLLGGIKTIAVQFVGQNLDAKDSWPTVTPGQNPLQVTLPKAIEFAIDIDGWGRITRLFRVVDSPSPPVSASGSQGPGDPSLSGEPSPPGEPSPSGAPAPPVALPQ